MSLSAVNSSAIGTSIMKSRAMEPSVKKSYYISLMENKPMALDVCCGGRMMYQNKQDSRVIFCDIRETHTTLCDGRAFDIAPDILCDFRSLPFQTETAPLIIFDPPHLRKAGPNSWLAEKYGTLPADGWKEYIADGFHECWRVLRVGGTLIFKWSEDQIKLSQIEDVFPAPPLFCNRFVKGKGFFIVFFKSE